MIEELGQAIRRFWGDDPIVAAFVLLFCAPVLFSLAVALTAGFISATFFLLGAG